VKTGDPATAQQRKQLSTQVAALAVAEHHVVAAPRVIAADLTASEAGELALVTTVLPGRSTIPPTMPAGRARRLGAMAATLHAVPLAPQPGLPFRIRPLPDVDFAAWRRSAGTSPLLVRAEERISELPAPGGTTVGDMAQCMPPLLDHGRPGLDAAILTARRDACLSAALKQLDQ